MQQRFPHTQTSLVENPGTNSLCKPKSLYSLKRALEKPWAKIIPKTLYRGHLQEFQGAPRPQPCGRKSLRIMLIVSSIDILFFLQKVE